MTGNLVGQKKEGLSRLLEEAKQKREGRIYYERRKKKQGMRKKECEKGKGNIVVRVRERMFVSGEG